MANVMTLSSVTLGMKAGMQGGTAIAPVSPDLTFSESFKITQGTGVGSVDMFYEADFNIVPSGNLTLDLSTGLLDPLGSALPAFARVKAILIWLLASPAAAKITLGAGTNPFVGPWGAGALDVPNGPSANADGYGGALCLMAMNATGWPVTAGTAHVLQVHNADATNAAQGRIFIAGCDA
jgi:hypothetical protein